MNNKFYIELDHKPLLGKTSQLITLEYELDGIPGIIKDDNLLLQNNRIHAIVQESLEEAQDLARIFYPKTNRYFVTFLDEDEYFIYSLEFKKNNFVEPISETDWRESNQKLQYTVL